MINNTQDLLEKYIPEIFGSESDENQERFSTVYKHELKGIIEKVIVIYTDKYFEDALELGILIKNLFNQSFGTTVSLERELYVKFGKELPKILNC